MEPEIINKLKTSCDVDEKEKIISIPPGVEIRSEFITKYRKQGWIFQRSLFTTNQKKHEV